MEFGLKPNVFFNWVYLNKWNQQWHKASETLRKSFVAPTGLKNRAGEFQGSDVPGEIIAMHFQNVQWKQHHVTLSQSNQYVSMIYIYISNLGLDWRSKNLFENTKKHEKTMPWFRSQSDWLGSCHVWTLAGCCMWRKELGWRTFASRFHLFENFIFVARPLLEQRSMSPGTFAVVFGAFGLPSHVFEVIRPHSTFPRC